MNPPLPLDFNALFVLNSVDGGEMEACSAFSGATRTTAAAHSTTFGHGIDRPFPNVQGGPSPGELGLG